MDIERMFSEKIYIFDPTIINNSHYDAIINSILKSILKGALEKARMKNFDDNMYIQIKADVLFIRQLSSLWLKDSMTMQTERLAEQVRKKYFNNYLFIILLV